MPTFLCLHQHVGGCAYAWDRNNSANGIHDSITVRTLSVIGTMLALLRYQLVTSRDSKLSALIRRMLHGTCGDRVLSHLAASPFRIP
jgi:hypothetical protein